jgi:Putative polyhydroxyalkanoic acid system protein (PHA_gran_rgn)
MSSLQIKIPHHLTQEEALARIKSLLVRIRQEQKDKISDVKEEWEGNSGSFQFKSFGQSLVGAINVNPSNVEINSKLPLTLSLFKGKIEEVIRDKAKELLA